MPPRAPNLHYATHEYVRPLTESVLALGTRNNTPEIFGIRARGLAQFLYKIAAVRACATRSLTITRLGYVPTIGAGARPARWGCARDADRAPVLGGASCGARAPARSAHIHNWALIMIGMHVDTLFL